MTGTVGVKPTYGGVSRYGLIACASSLDQGGPCARTVLDAALLHEVIAGHDPLDSTSIDAPVPRRGRGGPARAPTATCPGCGSGWSASWAARATSPGCRPPATPRCASWRSWAPSWSRSAARTSPYGAGRLLPDPAQRGARPTWPGSTRCATACGSSDRRQPQRRGGDGRDPGGRVRAGGQAPHHPRHLRAVLRVLRRLLRAGAEGAHADRARLRRRLRAGRRAGLADHADHGVPRSGRRSTTRWRCTSTTSPRSRPTWPAPPRCRSRPGCADDGLPVGLQIMAPGAGRGRDVPGRRGLRGRPRRRGRRPADPPCPLAAHGVPALECPHDRAHAWSTSTRSSSASTRCSGSRCTSS